MQNYTYYIYEIGILLSTDSTALASAVNMLLSSFEQNKRDHQIFLKLVFKQVSHRSEIPLMIPPSATAIFSCSGSLSSEGEPLEWRCDFYRLMTIKIADLNEHGIMVIDNQGGRVEGYLVEPDIRHPEVLARFFYIALSELLKAKGFYGVHAAGLEKNGYGILIPGSSGSGKTTCCLSLLRSGYRYISDDHVLLRENDGRFDMLSFPVRLDNTIFLESFFKEMQNRTGIATVNVTPKTIEVFPELSATQGYPYQEVDKRFFFVEDIYPHDPISTCEIHCIIFPQVVDYPKSYLEPLPKSKALEKLLPQGLLVFDPDVARRQFHSLSRLVEKTNCYQLYFGENVLELSQLVDKIKVNT